MINNIKNLTIIFLKDYYQNLNIIKNKKINKKSIYSWLTIILLICITYLSYQGISFFGKTGQPSLFLKIYLPIISFFMILQLIILTCRIFYYSKDLEYILPHPFKTEEILLAKLNTIIIIMYFIEIIFLIIPFIIYGLLIKKIISYFILMLLTILIFPILFTLIISIIMMFTMKLSKLIKNKDIFQLIITTVLTFIIASLLMQNIEQIVLKQVPENMEQLQIINMKIDEINKAFIIINPIIKILTENKFLIVIKNIIKIILINLSILILFIFIGKKLYLKNVLENINYIKKYNKINIKNQYKKNNKIKTYIKEDIKKIIKNPSFFMQNIFQYICIVIIFIILLNLFLPTFVNQVREENMIESIGIEDFKLQATLITVGAIQILFAFTNLSITAISREGKNAVFMKYIPISLFEQFKIKALPQIILNIPIILIILAIIYNAAPEIKIYYCIITFITIMLLNFINSYIMVFLDLKNPNLNWTNEESVSKNNGNKLYQYVITIFIFLILNYFSKIFEGINFNVAIIIINMLFLIIFLIIKKYIKNNINKIFKKIY